MSIDNVLLSLVNECDNCAMMGERIMCQSAPKEEMRLKCVALAKTALLEIILAEKPHRETPKLIANSYFNEGADEYEKKLREMFK